MFNARMRAPMKSTASIGAKFMLAVAVISAFSALLVKLAAILVNCVQVRATWIPPYTRKYWQARIMVHCTAGATGYFLVATGAVFVACPGSNCGGGGWKVQMA